MPFNLTCGSPGCFALARLEHDFFPRYTMIAYESRLRVLRRDQF